MSTDGRGCDLAGRTAALWIGALAAVAAMCDIAIWSSTRQRACPDGYVQFFPLTTIGAAISVAVALTAALTVAVATRRTSHRLGAVVAVLLAVLAFVLSVAAVLVGHGRVTSCFTF